MGEIDFREGCTASEFLALARRVWPRDHSVPDAAATLEDADARNAV